MKKERVIYFDVLNICACLAVIFLHSNSVHNYSEGLGWKYSLIIEVLAYWAVPIFLMISGANLMGYRKRYSTKEFLIKRFSKTLIPFLFWSVVMVFTKGYWDTMKHWSIRGWLNYIFLTKIEQVYWFFIPLFAIYICMPVLSCLAEEKYRKTLWYLVVIAFFVQGVVPVFFPMLGLDLWTNITFPVADGMLIYAVLGWLLATEELDRKKRMLIYAAGGLSALFRFVMTYVLSVSAGEVVKTYFGYMQFHAALFAAAVFVFAKNACARLKVSDRFKGVLAKISSASFGIYLTHMIVLRFFTDTLGAASLGWLWRIAAPFVIYLVCLLGVSLIKRVPVLRALVP